MYALVKEQKKEKYNRNSLCSEQYQTAPFKLFRKYCHRRWDEVLSLGIPDETCKNIFGFQIKYKNIVCKEFILNGQNVTGKYYFGIWERLSNRSLAVSIKYHFEGLWTLLYVNINNSVTARKYIKILNFLPFSPNFITCVCFYFRNLNLHWLGPVPRTYSKSRLALLQYRTRCQIESKKFFEIPRSYFKSFL